METNGVYFGAEIVRDLTPAPGSRMEKMEKRRPRGREGGVGEGREREPSLWLPLACFLSATPLSVPLCPSVSLPLSSPGCQSRPAPSPPSIPYVFLFWQGSRTPCFGSQAAP